MLVKDKTIYPPYWKQFSEFIRFTRAEGYCEDCGIPNGFRRENGAVVVLTVAHLDHDGGPCECLARLGRKCAKPSHVAALCQKCHNTLDAPARRINAAATLATKLDGQRGLLKLAGGAR